ncbi:TonB-dependent receptor domain-containing protein [Ursidibacter sp. B-7004-1]
MSNNVLKSNKYRLSVVSALLPFLIASLYTKNAYSKTESLYEIKVNGQSANKDQNKKNSIFLKDQITEYKSRKEIEIYRGHSISDLLSGISGVYSADARNSGAIDPVIRGVQGQGRIPILVDGTEQAITIWRGFSGVSNRNYLDPFLISSVEVEKGPNLDRTLRSGVAGTIKMKTLDVDDIVKTGESFGAELKIETANNSIKARHYPYVLGVDYRDNKDPINPMIGETELDFKINDRQKSRSYKRNHFFQDNAYRLALAIKEDKFEGLVAYAYRNKGNYFSGNGGAHKYGEHLVLQDIAHLDPNYNEIDDDPYIPWIAETYRRKNEVPNTSFNSQSWLVKGAYNITPSTKMNLGVRHSHIKYGDIMPSQLLMTRHQLGTVVEWPLANVKQTALNIDIHHNPKDIAWIDLKLGAWALWNTTLTNTSGASPSSILFYDGKLKNMMEEKAKALKRDKKLGLIPKETNITLELKKLWNQYAAAEDRVSNDDGVFNTQNAQAQFSKDNYWGFNISNRFVLSSKLNLDVMANYRQETLDSHNIFNLWEKYNVSGKKIDSCDPKKIHICRITSESFSGSRMGTRNEFNAGFNFELIPSDWLILNMGMQYVHYKSRDDGLRKRLANKNREDVKFFGRIPFRYKRLMTEQEFQTYQSYLARENAYYDSKPDQDDYENDDEYYAALSVFNSSTPHPLNNKEVEFLQEIQMNDGRLTDVIYWERDEYGNFPVDKFPLYQVDFLKKLTDVSPNLYNEGEIEKVIDTDINASLDKGGIDAESAPDALISPTEEQWKKMLKGERKDHAWSPALSATVFVTDNSRIYFRYNETKRMPSIFEDTIGYSTDVITPLYNRKPEHSKNFEIGYVHNLLGILPEANYADIKINYFHNKTRNIYDRDITYEMKQYNKRVLSGIELQARYDQGNFFSSIGITYNLKNRFCDESSAIRDRRLVSYADDFRAYPTCVNGGNKNGFLKNAILPKYSVDFSAGTRLLDERLEVGTRLKYHSNVKNSRNKSLQDAGFTEPTDLDGNGSVVRWEPVFLVDAYVNYKLNKNTSLEIVGTNLTNQYYLDPMTRSFLPAPGRTVKLGVTVSF